ncbi:hypothetical protein [Luteolibacter marinus]|uniref:hypothetical protein n=1 Tax=Luteolibacter marinus TaxID=2776705 RepID=UPI001866FD80|nr:hypothetical protein [Luteolibacter marinus]
MSAIGSFHLFDDAKRDDIVRAAEAQSKALRKKRFGFLPPKLPLNPDPFWDFMRRHVDELEDYPFSGFLLLDLELLAPGVLGSKDPVGGKLSAITGSTFISFRPAESAAATAILDAADLSPDAIRGYLVEEQREEEYPAIVSPIQVSAQHLGKWLASVTPGKTGLLSIG